MATKGWCVTCGQTVSEQIADGEERRGYVHRMGLWEKADEFWFSADSEGRIKVVILQDQLEDFCELTSEDMRHHGDHPMNGIVLTDTLSHMVEVWARDNEPAADGPQLAAALRAAADQVDAVVREAG